MACQPDGHRSAKYMKRAISLVLVLSLLLVASIYNRYDDLKMNGLILESKKSLTSGSMPTIYVITPTYWRLEQLAELTRLAQTLLNVPSIHWIVVEDSDGLSTQVADLLHRYAIPHTHLHARMPEEYRNMTYLPRGVSNRNAALDWLRWNGDSFGVFYFADDDNAYDIRLFEEMRYTKKLSMWPVGLIGTYGVSSPIVDCSTGNVTGFFDSWKGKRLFPVDMAGFAINVHYFLKHPDAFMPYRPGYEEDGFLRSLNLTWADVEPRAEMCSKILVWHTKTRSSTWIETKSKHPEVLGTNIDALLDYIHKNNSIIT